jgi:hypothetical protein
MSMGPTAKILLGNGWHTLFSDEPWYLTVIPDSGEIWLEARFQSDAPDRTGYPLWASTEFCVSKGDGQAICRVPYESAAHLLTAVRLSLVPEAIWAKALVECRKLGPSSEDTA